jgi:nifR3 family TIM-barrel protein
MTSSFWQEKITFNGLSVPRFMSAPLDGITTSPLRRLIRDFSTEELLFTEMRHVSQVCNEKDKKSLQFHPSEQPLGFQFSANATTFLDKAVEMVIERGFVMINLNAGCPAPAVVKSGSGSALMADITLLETLIKAFSKAINGRIPFTLKMRAGFKRKNALDVAKMAYDNGVVGLIVHPRTQTEKFGGQPDFELVKQMKQSLNVPIIFSGNINTFADAKRTYELTGCDGFMIGRALWGAPWKLREITDAAQGKEFVVDLKTIVAYAIKHLDLNLEFYGPKGFIMLKKQLPEYLSAMPHASAWRKKLLQSKTEAEMRTILLQLLEGPTCVP